jgi:pimeloyl-ACP methyl ester carboxylesterase
MRWEDSFWCQGCWHGAWAFETVNNALSSEGHEVQALTLSGLGDEPANGANLECHINEVVPAIRRRDPRAVLVGHSYGGMVITGAADKEPARVKAIVYADAYVPDNGPSLWSLTTPQLSGAFHSGCGFGWFDLRAARPPRQPVPPHPIATFLQAIKLTGNWRNVRSKGFIAACGWEGSPFIGLYERLRLDPEWGTHRLDCAHDVPRLAPEALTRILLKYV